MKKIKISTTDLIWVFHEKLNELGDRPQQGFSIAVVRTTGSGWRAVTSIRLRNSRWIGPFDAIEKRLQKVYDLTD